MRAAIFRTWAPDAAGRRRYLYHPQWQADWAEEKYDRVLSLAQRLPDCAPRSSPTCAHAVCTASACRRWRNLWSTVAHGGASWS